jgi:hypothetical protein
MIDEKTLELIHAEIDGELPEQHRAELSRHLLSSPEARAAREELRRVCALLDRVQPVEPPPDLRASILGAVKLPGSAAGTQGPQRFWAPPGILRYAAVFAGGLIVSAIAFQVGLDREGGLDVSQVAGTMVSQDPVASTKAVDTVNVALEQVRGSVSLFRSPTMRVVEFDLAARQPVEVVVVHDGQEARFTGFGQTGAGGNQRYALVLDGPGQEGAPIELRFLSSGTLVHRDTLEVPASR